MLQLQAHCVALMTITKASISLITSDVKFKHPPSTQKPITTLQEVRFHCLA
jgi:hypothetical protein